MYWQPQVSYISKHAVFLIEIQWISGSRFQPRRLLNSSSFGQPNRQLYTEQFSLKEIQTLAEWLLHIRGTRKKSISKWVGEAETQSRHNCKSCMAAYDQEQNHNSQLLPEEQRVWDLAPQLLRLPPEGQAPKTCSSENQWSLRPWDPQDYSKKRNSS